MFLIGSKLTNTCKWMVKPKTKEAVPTVWTPFLLSMYRLDRSRCSIDTQNIKTFLTIFSLYTHKYISKSMNKRSNLHNTAYDICSLLWTSTWYISATLQRSHGAVLHSPKLTNAIHCKNNFFNSEMLSFWILTDLQSDKSFSSIIY